MTKNTKVQFVIFETTLPAGPFFKRWNEYKRSEKSDRDVIIQQAENNGIFRYIAQHRFASEDVQFVFTKPKRSARIPQESIKAQKAGGYSLLQAECITGTGLNESKVFAFINDPTIDLGVFKDLSRGGKLNIYEPWYQNCQFAYILEYFVKTNLADALAEELQKFETVNTAVYKECKHVKNTGVSAKEEQLHEWPSF